MVRSAAQNTKVKIRNPQAIRPWQHVLEPLGGYLLLGQKLLEGHLQFAEAWNFGPSGETDATVGEIADMAKQFWPAIECETETTSNQPHEADMLKLDCSKARTKLKWAPVWDIKRSIQTTLEWYRAFYEKKLVKSIEDINHYITDAKIRNVPWVE